MCFLLHGIILKNNIVHTVLSDAMSDAEYCSNHLWSDNEIKIKEKYLCNIL